MKRAIFTFLALLALSVTSYGEIAKVKGKGEITYSGAFGQSTGEVRAAITEAKKNALSRYAATFDSARFELYKKIEPMLFASIDQYVSDYTQLDQQIDKSSKHYTVIIEASINPEQIETAIQASAGPASAQPSADTSYLTFVFVARELGARKVFDDKRTVVEINNATQSGAEKNAVAEDGQYPKERVHRAHRPRAALPHVSQRNGRLDLSRRDAGAAERLSGRDVGTTPAQETRGARSDVLSAGVRPAIPARR